MLIDPKVIWTSHAVYIYTKLSEMIYLFRILFNKLSKPNLKYAFFESIFRYGLLIYDNETVLIMRKRLIREMTRSKYDEPCQPLFKQEKL
jgi:hypothetical protein